MLCELLESTLIYIIIIIIIIIVDVFCRENRLSQLAEFIQPRFIHIVIRWTWFVRFVMGAD